MKKSGLIILLILLLFAACTVEWEDHYGNAGKSVNVKLWDTLKSLDKYSEFVKSMEFLKLDTVIKSSNSKTLFIPTNEAFIEYFDDDTTGFRETMAYHIIPTFFLLQNVENNHSRKLKTYFKKFALIQNLDNIYYIDGIEIVGNSSLFLDGKFYEIERVVRPKPNLYEYLRWNNPPIKKYIDLQDTVILDMEKSKPLGFNEQGETIYDSVVIISNRWEEEYFPISKEFRDIYATMIIPDQLSYDAALDDMSKALGGSYLSHEDIPSDWQNSILIPILLYQGTFGGLWNPNDFNKKIIVNIVSDTINFNIDIDTSSRKICTNGWVYNYSEFSIGDSLYLRNILEPENFVENIGFNKFSWSDEGVKVEGNSNYLPVKQQISGASNDTIVSVKFVKGYNGDYALTLTMKHIFPQKYRMVWRTQYRISGVFSVYINGVKVLLGLDQLEEFDTIELIDGFYSVTGIKFYPDSKGFCDVDAWVENLTDYGNVDIRFEYQSPGFGFENGLSIDYIGLFAE
jgi:hypothetical protein